MLIIDLSWLPGGCENLLNTSISTKSLLDGSMQEASAGTRSYERGGRVGVEKKQIISNWWEQSKNYRAPAIWSDHFRSAWAKGGNWILKTSFIVDQLLCFKYLKEESDFLQAWTSVWRSTCLWSGWFCGIVCEAFGCLQLGWAVWLLSVLTPTGCPAVHFNPDAIYLDLVSYCTV